MGEIDSAGNLLTSTNPVPSMYYLFSLLDSQAGLAIGVLMLMGVFYAIKTRKEQDLLLLSATLPGVLFFTLVAKKQVYYTFPMLVPLALVGWTIPQSVMDWNGLWSLAVVATMEWGDFHEYSGTTNHSCEICGAQLRSGSTSFSAIVSSERCIGIDSGSASEVIVFSEDQGWYEGFVVLQLREQLDGNVRGSDGRSHRDLGVFRAS